MISIEFQYLVFCMNHESMSAANDNIPFGEAGDSIPEESGLAEATLEMLAEVRGLLGDEITNPAKIRDLFNRLVGE